MEGLKAEREEREPRVTTRREQQGTPLGRIVLGVYLGVIGAAITLWLLSLLLLGAIIGGLK
jgi:hypothetical protein